MKEEKSNGSITNKIDFEVVIMVNHGNPNGDPIEWKSSKRRF